MEATYHAITTHRKTQNACLEVCCYGIDIGASIVRFNQSENSNSRIWTNESAPPCSSPVIVVGEVEPVQSIAEEDSGQGGSQEEPHHGHSNWERELRGIVITHLHSSSASRTCFVFSVL